MSMKKPISVSAMAAQLNLSRSHFYYLMDRKIFPKPVKVGSRIMFTPDRQEICLEVKKTGITLAGKYVCFNEKAKTKAKTTAKPVKKYESLIEALNGLGLDRVTNEQVDKAMKSLYPSTTPDVESGDVIKAVFLHLRS